MAAGNMNKHALYGVWNKLVVYLIRSVWHASPVPYSPALLA